MFVLDYHLEEKRILRLFVVHHRTTPPRSPLSRRVHVLHFPSSQRCIGQEMLSRVDSQLVRTFKCINPTKEVTTIEGTSCVTGNWLV